MSLKDQRSDKGGWKTPSTGTQLALPKWNSRDLDWYLGFFIHRLFIFKQVIISLCLCYGDFYRHLLLARKAMANLDRILKSKDTTLLKNIHRVKTMIFPVVIYRCESWTIKNADHRRIDAFELWCWRAFLRVPWTARRSNQSILKEVSLGRTDAEVKALILWLPNMKSQLIGKDSEAGRD